MSLSKIRNLILAGVVTAVGLALVQPPTEAEEPALSRDEAEDLAEDRAPELDGATVFAWYCGSCHSERYPKERTDAEWDLIVSHMRVRANLTGEQARAVLRYLQENNQ